MCFSKFIMHFLSSDYDFLRVRAFTWYMPTHKTSEVPILEACVRLEHLIAQIYMII
jgi:hypothetical protein